MAPTNISVLKVAAQVVGIIGCPIPISRRLVRHRDRHVPMQFRRGGNLPQQLDRKEQHVHSAASRSFTQGPLDRKPGRFALELAIEQNDKLVGNCEGGYTCAYLNTVAWP